MKVFEGAHTLTLPHPKKTRNCLAKALYDNTAEAPDELAFRKNDVLTVLEQNPNGLEGWWLCSLRGRQGIAPGNRLRLLPGMYDPTGLGYASEGWTTGGTYPGPGNRHSRRRSWHTNANKVVTPQKIGDVYMYDIPIGHKSLEAVDSPHSATLPSRKLSQTCSLQGSYDTPPSPRLAKSVEAYDEPRPVSQCYSIPPPPLDMTAYDEPRSHASVSSDSSTVSSTYSIPKGHDYDVPSSEDSGAYDIPTPSRHTSTTDSSSLSDTYDVPSSKLISDISTSNRSSGVSVLSASSSSFFSPSSGHASLSPSLSLSSLCGSNRSSLEQHSHELYDIPPPEPRPITNLRGSPARAASIPSCTSAIPPVIASDMYDIPASNIPAEFYDVPPAPKPAQPSDLDAVYDVPPQVTRDISPLPPHVEDSPEKRLSLSSTDSRDLKETLPSLKGKELLLDLDAAMEILVKLQQEVHSAITKLFSFVSSSWRRKEVMDSKIHDIKEICYKIDSTLKEFLNFAHGALANSTHAADRTLSTKLAKLIKPLVDSSSIIQVSLQNLDQKEWQVTKLEISDNTPDELDQMVACSQGIIEDVRPVASFIRGNSTLIFKRSPRISDLKYDIKKPAVAPKPTDLRAKFDLLSGQKIGSSSTKVQERPLPSPPPPSKSQPNNKAAIQTNEIKETVINDYEYVNLESKESVEKQKESLRTDNLKDEEKVTENLSPRPSESNDETVLQLSALDIKDVQMLQFYTAQTESHILYLTDAIDSFLSAIENNQPPKVFIGHSKFVVISAYKLVYIGDTVQCHVSNKTVKTQVTHCVNNLCDSLKTLVANTKKASLQFPSVTAVQEMVDSVVDVSHLANDLRMIILQATQP